jgi:CheY-like chemotaxis protein
VTRRHTFPHGGGRVTAEGLSPVEAPSLVLDILVVDDDSADVALVEDFLTNGGMPCRLSVASDGQEALSFLRREGKNADAPRPDLVLLDLNMPRVDGRKALELIKGDPALRSIPVVVFTTSSSIEDIHRSYEGHANAYVTKPIELADFERVVGEIHHFYAVVAQTNRV